MVSLAVGSGTVMHQGRGGKITSPFLRSSKQSIKILATYMKARQNVHHEIEKLTIESKRASSSLTEVVGRVLCATKAKPMAASATQ